MALYVRLHISFWNHRKTLRLRAALGDDALWLMPRLWSYAAENQPDGCFENYSAQELALLLGYSKDAQAMLQAMQQAGYLAGMSIHGWGEHNGYHQVFADRAKAAADARWEKARAKKEKKGKDKKGQEASIATSMLQASKAKGTLEEIAAFCLEIGLPESDAKACFFKWEANGWVNGKNPIKCWKSTIRSWREAGYLPSQKPGINGARPTERISSLADHEG